MTDSKGSGEDFERSTVGMGFSFWNSDRKNIHLHGKYSAIEQKANLTPGLFSLAQGGLIIDIYHFKAAIIEAPSADSCFGMRVAPHIELEPSEREPLRKLTTSHTCSVRLARRAKIILLAAEGLSNHEIAEKLNIGRIQVGRWHQRYALQGLSGISL